MTSLSVGPRLLRPLANRKCCTQFFPWSLHQVGFNAKIGGSFSLTCAVDIRMVGTKTQETKPPKDRKLESQLLGSDTQEGSKDRGPRTPQDGPAVPGHTKNPKKSLPTHAEIVKAKRLERAAKKAAMAQDPNAKGFRKFFYTEHQKRLAPASLPKREQKPNLACGAKETIEVDRVKSQMEDLKRLHKEKRKEKAAKRAGRKERLKEFKKQKAAVRAAKEEARRIRRAERAANKQADAERAFEETVGEILGEDGSHGQNPGHESSERRSEWKLLSQGPKAAAEPHAWPKVSLPGYDNPSSSGPRTGPTGAAPDEKKHTPVGPARVRGTSSALQLDGSITSAPPATATSGNAGGPSLRRPRLSVESQGLASDNAFQHKKKRSLASNEGRDGPDKKGKQERGQSLKKKKLVEARSRGYKKGRLERLG